MPNLLIFNSELLFTIVLHKVWFCFLLLFVCGFFILFWFGLLFFFCCFFFLQGVLGFLFVCLFVFFINTFSAYPRISLCLVCGFLPAVL